MLRRRLIFIFLFLPFAIYAQEGELPPDFRQHNLTEYNSSLLSPIFSLDRNQPRSLALWTRWQWQTIDGDPTTFLFNYTHRFSAQSAAGLGFFQHNTGYFLQTGAVANYAYGFDLGSGMQLALGLNAFGYQRKPADELFQPNPDIPFPQFDVSNDFILQLAPSLRFRYDRFSIGLVGENLVDYNFTNSEQETSGSDKIYIGLMSYQIPVFIFGSSETSFLQPTLYMKTLPGMDDQFGLTGLFSTPKFWAQLGYNNFYGVSGGVGGRFFQNFSIGALLEFGSDTSFEGSDTTIELVTAYSFGPGDTRRKVVGFDVPSEEEVLAIAEPEAPVEEAVDTDVPEIPAEVSEAREREEKALDSIAAVREREALAAAADAREQRRQARRKSQRDSLAAVEQQRLLREQRVLDSIAEVRREAALAEARRREVQKQQDSLAQLAIARREAAEKQEAQETVTPEPGEKYEETRTVDGLVPGYYLIANVFGTKKYYDAFMKTLSDRGLEPKSFYRSVNKYNYVYLQRYDSIEAAREARNSKFNGRYTENLWIFRVVGN